MDERRKIQRKYLVFFGRVFDRQTAEVLGNIADITADGAMVISDHPIETDQIFHLRLDIPDYEFGTDHLDLDARSVWCQPDIDPMHYNTGFQWIGVSDTAKKLIEQIVSQYEIRKGT